MKPIDIDFNVEDFYAYFKNKGILERYYTSLNANNLLHTCLKCGGELQLFCWETHYVEKCEDCGEEIELK